MSEDSTDRGARRRAAVRSALGKPGSLGRWLVGTALWLAVCAAVAPLLPWGAQIILLIFALLVPASAYKASTLMIGDEDELNAALRRRRSNPAPETDFREEEAPLDPESWLSHRGRSFEGVPPPPIAEDETDADEGEPRPWSPES